MEAFLVANGVAFDRHHDFDMGRDGKLARFRPGWDTVRACATNTDWNIVLEADRIAEVRERMRSGDVSRDETLAALDRLLEDRDVEDLPPLEVAD